jgi:hypothetical protein
MRAPAFGDQAFYRPNRRSDSFDSTGPIAYTRKNGAGLLP